MLINEDPLSWTSGLSDDDLQMFPELGPALEDEAALPADDFLEALSSDLEIPMLLSGSPNYNEESADEIIEKAMKEQTLQSLQDVELDMPSCMTDDFNSIFTNVSEEVIIKDVKLEPCSPVIQLPPSPSQSESSNGSEYQSDISVINHSTEKLGIDTPPISPPQNESPPTSPVPAQNMPVLQKVKLLPLNSINLRDGSTQKFLLSGNNPAKRICIQPKSENSALKDSRKTIVLSPEDFAALTQNMKHKNCTQPLKVQALPVTKPVKIQNNSTSNSATTQNQIKIINAPSPAQIHSKSAVVSMLSPVTTKNDLNPQSQILFKNDHTICPSSIVIKNDVPVCPPILIKKENPNVMPIVVKNEFPEFIDYHDRQDSEIKALKRQQRMIKNRESACLSRKKKKEYVTSLENEIAELKEQNMQLLTENVELKKRISHLEGNSIKKFGNQTFGVNKKGTAILFAMVFMVSLNLGGFGLNLKRPPLDDSPNHLPMAISNVRHGGRTLLWSNSEDEDVASSKENLNDTLPMYLSMCSKYVVNQTESERIYYELSHLTGKKPILSTRSSATFLEDKNKASLKNDLIKEKLRTENPKPLSKKLVKQYQKRNFKINQIPSTTSLNAVQVFSPISKEYAKLFDVLGKKDDTMYLVYFTEKDLHLPALRTNNTIRPKMSLVIPAFPVDGHTPQDHITMMQIESEVTNTQLLHLQQNLIPKHLRRDGQFKENQSQDNNINIPEEALPSARKYYARSSFLKKNIDNSVVNKEFNNNFKYDEILDTEKNVEKNVQKEFANQTEELKKAYPEEKGLLSRKLRRNAF